MATMDDNALFVDTNALVYANIVETPFHEQALAAIPVHLWFPSVHLVPLE